MNTVTRGSRFRRIVRRYVFGMPEKRYGAAGDRACRAMVESARSRRSAIPSNEIIMARALYDLRREIRNGFWDRRTAYSV